MTQAIILSGCLKRCASFRFSFLISFHILCYICSISMCGWFFFIVILFYMSNVLIVLSHCWGCPSNFFFFFNLLFFSTLSLSQEAFYLLPFSFLASISLSATRPTAPGGVALCVLAKFRPVLFGTSHLAFTFWPLFIASSLIQLM